MIQIQSYLKGPDGTFMPIDVVDQPPADPHYIEGAIELSIDGTKILDLDLWDYVDQLWAYICEMARDLVDTGQASIHFPDQPIELTFQRIGGGQVMVISTPRKGSRRAVASERELVECLRNGAATFFTRLTALLPAQQYGDALDRINAAWESLVATDT